MNQHFNLETIFNLIDFPKAKQRPPAKVEMLGRYYEEDYSKALKELGAMRKTGETSTYSRKLYLYHETGIGTFSFSARKEKGATE